MSDPSPPPVASLDLPAAMRAEIEHWLIDPEAQEDRATLEAWLHGAADGDVSALAELEDAFAGPLPIGTGGRRGACGPGPNRMNAVVLRQTARGLATAMRNEGVPSRVAIVFDTRRHSRRFAELVAETLIVEGIDVELVGEPRPTPELSFLVRRRGCGAGVVISASHNPPTDNGIKIYGPDGAQVLGPRDRALMAAIEAQIDAHNEGSTAKGTVGRAGRIVRFQSPAELAELDDPYLEFVRAQGVAPLDLSHCGLKVVYTPLHGVGHTSVVPVVRGKGVDLAVAECQLDDGGSFSTLTSANPEAPAAFDCARGLAEKVGADLVIATDPDADRLGALARTAAGAYEFVDGNRLGVLMLDHVLRHGSVPAHGWVLSTLVTTPLLSTMARAHGVVAVDDLLVGFKHHAGMMAEQPERTVVFATEEAHGYLRGDDVHDKDGAIAALLLVEAAALAKAAGRTLFDVLDDIWARYGYHRERTANLFAPGAAGRQATTRLMEAWRREPPARLGRFDVAEVIDRKHPRSTGSPTRDLPGNVVVLELRRVGAIAGRLVLRPSGTEPKIKIYALLRHEETTSVDVLASVRAAVDDATDELLAAARAAAEPWLSGESGA